MSKADATATVAPSVIKRKLDAAKNALADLTSVRVDLFHALRPALTPETPTDPVLAAGQPDITAQSSIADDLDDIIQSIDNERRIIRAVVERIEV